MIEQLATMAVIAVLPTILGGFLWFVVLGEPKIKDEQLESLLLLGVITTCSIVLQMIFKLF